METPNEYVASVDYINNLNFDYIETYSFQRETEYEENLKAVRPKYDELKVGKEKQNNLKPTEESRFFIIPFSSQRTMLTATYVNSCLLHNLFIILL